MASGLNKFSYPFLVSSFLAIFYIYSNPLPLSVNRLSSFPATAMAISIVNHQIPDSTHDLYSVTFFQDTILTLVTHTPSSVDTWISDIERIYNRRLHPVIVGLDVEWRPNKFTNYQNPVATLQLCVGRHCLIFQLLFAPKMPQSLRNFLRSPSYKFTGVGIGKDVEKLTENWNLVVASMADVGVLAAEEYGMMELRNVGLKGLTKKVLKKDLVKPKDVTISDWDDEHLTQAQVQYACIDAFLSYKIGRFLIQRT